MLDVGGKQELTVGWWLLVEISAVLNCASKHQEVSSARHSSVCTFLPASSLLTKGVSLTHSFPQGLSSEVQV